MAARDEIVSYLNELLDIHNIDDYSVNGLQVEGRPQVLKIGLATDAALAVYDTAVSEKCDMLLTHHGLIWKGIRSVTGRDYRHIKRLLDADINLYAAHLPLDMHPEVGNNAVLAKMMGIAEPDPFGEYHGATIGFCGDLPSPTTVDQLAATLAGQLGGTPKVLPFGPKAVTKVAIVSGGGGSMLEEAARKGFDCYITGEGSHPNHHLALESGLNVIYLGHYHSETVGVKALGEKLVETFGVETLFIDEPTAF